MLAGARQTRRPRGLERRPAQRRRIRVARHRRGDDHGRRQDRVRNRKLAWMRRNKCARTDSSFGQRTGEASSQARSTPVDDPVKALVGRLDLERYKATIKGLTQPVLVLLWSGTGGAVRQPRQGALLLSPR